MDSLPAALGCNDSSLKAVPPLFLLTMHFDGRLNETSLILFHAWEILHATFLYH